MSWDQILVYVIVAGAALYLLLGSFRKRKKAGCGGCHSCPGDTAPQQQEPPLVQLEVSRKASPGDDADGRT
jgi:hypothetical protein